MTGHDELIKAAEKRVDTRAPRLVTLSVGVRLDGADGLILAGTTTGLNEHGLGARVNLLSGTLPADPAGIHLRVSLNLPGGHDFHPIESSVLHISPCWIPGFRFFTAVRFLQADVDDIRFLRDFIRWREDDHFTPEKPIRKWYVFTQEEQRVFGPLTREEVLDSSRRAAIRACDLIWSPMRGEWVSCLDNRIEARLRAIEEEEFFTSAAPAEKTSARRTVISAGAAVADAPDRVETVETTTSAAIPVTEKRHGETPAELLAGLSTPLTPAPSRTKPLFAPIQKGTIIPTRWVIGACVLLLCTALVAAFIEGTLDRTEPGLILADARRALKVGERSTAIQLFASLQQQFPGHRLAVRANEYLVDLLREERRDRERQIGVARLDLLNRLSTDLRADPAVANAIGDCLYRSGEYAGAIERFEKALQAVPHNGIYQYNLGTAFLKRREYQKAEERLNEPGLEMGSDPRYHFNAGLVFLGLRDVGRQRSFFDAAERLAANPAWIGMVIAAAAASSSVATADAFVTIAEPLGQLESNESFEILRRLEADQPNPATFSIEAIPGETIVKAAPHMRHVLLADFDLDGTTEREIVCPVGAWSSRPESLNLRSNVTHDCVKRVGDFGASLRVDYNLFTDEPGELGAWMLLEKQHEPIDMTSARFLVLQLRGGDTEAIFPGNVLIELRNRSEASRVLLAGVSNDWREFRIPLVHFTGITDWRAMTELLIVIDPTSAEKRSGSLTIDSIRLEG